MRASAEVKNGTGERDAVRMSSVFRIAVLSGMALLWAIVAVLQYKWATQLSGWAEVRIGSNLQSLMTRWQRDLYDEWSAVCVALHVGPDAGAHDAWYDYLQRYGEWTRNGINSEVAESAYPNPDLVREVYDWHTCAPGKPELLRLDPNAKTLDSIGAPQGLETLLARLKANSSNLTVAKRAWEYGSSSENESASGSNQVRTLGSRTDALAGWQLDEEIPALVHPIVHHANPFNSQTPVDRVAVDWLVVAFNLEVIRNRILPELANGHFGGPDGLEYKLAVVALGRKPRFIYSSDATLRVDDVGTFDSIMDIFGSSSNDVQGELWQTLRHRGNLTGQDWRHFSAPRWFPVIQYGPVDKPWVLVLQHRTAPVTKIARSAWRRDLLTGGFALVLLAANIGLVLSASIRAQKLATAQLEFVASVSHELLTPLSAIYCSGQNAKDGLLQTKADLAAHGSIVTSQARQLIDLVKQNLLFAATESGTNRYTMRPVQVSEILHDVRNSIGMLIEESGSSIEYAVPAGLPNVTGDLSVLTQCLRNLVTNAIKYSGRNSRVHISASLHEVKND